MQSGGTQVEGTRNQVSSSFLGKIAHFQSSVGGTHGFEMDFAMTG